MSDVLEIFRVPAFMFASGFLVTSGGILACKMAGIALITARVERVSAKTEGEA